MLASATIGLWLLASGAAARPVDNSTYYNPILPGFHPDPSCIFVPELEDTFFCASSSFNAFPGLPIHASKDLRNWKLIGNALNRREQLPRLQETNRSTSGIWAPALRFHNGTFYIVTTLVDDDRPREDSSRWDNMIFSATDPYDSSSWSNPVHFDFAGYDPSPFWDVDGKVYMTASHAWQIEPGLRQAEIDLGTGKAGEWKVIWKGTGGLAPEGPHIYLKDGYYYLLAAEGGTGVNHMVTMARSKAINGPYDPCPSNPVLTNANTTEYFQTVGHADLFQDRSGNWWGVALATRSGPKYTHYPMGRETVLTPVTWDEGEWPVWKPIQGEMNGWHLPREQTTNLDGAGPFIADGDDIKFAPGSSLPAHFAYWRAPIKESYTISPEGHPNTLRLTPSRLNLTALNGNYAGPTGQTFVSRRQQDTFFTYSVDIDYAPSALDEEAGVTVFLTQNHHLSMGIVMLPASARTMAFPGTNATMQDEAARVQTIPHLRFRGASYTPVPDPVIVPIPSAWLGHALTLEIKASNTTHYSFSAGPANAESQLQTIVQVSNQPVSYAFTGTLLGIYCTSNGGAGATPAYFSKWTYIPQGQVRD